MPGFDVLLFNVPHVGEQAVVPVYSVQVTPVFDVPLTVAVNSAVPLASTWAVDGETLTEAAGTVIETESDFVESATEVALIVTVRALDGGVLGAV